MANSSSGSSTPHTANGALKETLTAAHKAYGSGDLRQAEALCRRSLSLAPEQPDALALLALIAHRVGKLDDAIHLLQQALRVGPARAADYSNLCEMLRQAGRLDDAEIAGRKAVELDARRVSHLSNLGIVLQEKNQLDEAEKLLRRAIKKDPAFAQAHSNLGNTLKKMDRLHEAVKAFHEAVRLKPDYAEAWSNLSVALHALGDEQAGLKAAVRAVRINPGYAEGHNNAAVILRELERYEEAEVAARQALRVRPDYADAYGCLALVFQDQGRMNLALETVDKALAIRRTPELLATYAQILHKVGRLPEAIVAYRQAIELNPMRAESWNGYALALVEDDKADEARAAFAKAVELQPSKAPSYLFNAAYAKKVAADDPLEQQLLGLQRKFGDGATATQRAHLNYSLAKINQDLGRYDEAWQSYMRGAAAKRSMLPGNIVQRNEDVITRIRELFTSELFEQHQGKGDPSERPIFIVGMPRSGTSLAEQILASHPNVVGAGELPDMGLVLGNIREKPGAPRIHYPDFLTQLNEGMLKAMGAAYVKGVTARIADTPRFVDKMPGNFAYVGLIKLMFPNARIIHCRRDPLDTCVSCFTHLFSGHQDFSYDLEELGRYYRSYETLMDHWQQVMPEGSVLELTYEDVVSDLEAQVRRMLAFCGLDWDERCLSFHETERVVRTASMTQVRQPLYQTSVQRWKRYEKHLGPLKAALGLEQA
jgi:tetratricopeptide (TPR) repeat protein